MREQIEAADYVLLVCTETYKRRFEGEDREGGRGVTFEGMVIGQTLRGIRGQGVLGVRP
jgi:hypothetical protein